MRTARGKFKHCQVKKVGLGPGYSNPFAYEASLACPNPDGNNLRSNSAHNKAQGAVRDLKKVAAAVACGSCVLYKLSRVELLTAQAAEANAEADLARALRRRLVETRDYQVALEVGAIEVDAINQSKLGEEAPLVSTGYLDAHPQAMQLPADQPPELPPK